MAVLVPKADNANSSQKNPSNIMVTVPTRESSAIVLLEFRSLQSIQHSFILADSSEVFSDICWALLSSGTGGHLSQERLLVSSN